MQVVKPRPQPKVIPSDLYGNHVSGKCWSEGSGGEYASVTKITVTVNKDVLTSIQLQYKKCDGKIVHGEKHGGCGETKVFILDYLHEECLLEVSGFYGPEPSAGGVDIIKSLTFHTNKRKLIVGKEKGTHFVMLPKVGKEEEHEAAVNCPPPPPPPAAGPIVGFFGRADTAFLYAIGVYYEFPCPCPPPP